MRWRSCFWPVALAAAIWCIGVVARAETKPKTFSWALESANHDDPLIQQGFLPVTKYGADPTGARECSTEIQSAIDAAYEHNMACFFPAGIYLVNKQLVCRQVGADMTKAHVLIGSFKGNQRPVIRLVDSSTNFDDAVNPQAVVFMQALTDGAEDVPSGYNMCFRGINLELGSGNVGAIGVYMHGAQGCTIQDIRVSASGPFHAGVRHMVGSGGGYQNIEVIGGTHAIDASADSAKHPAIAGLRAINQTGEIVKIGTATPITVVGLYAERDTGPAFTLAKKGNECTCHLSLVDAVVKFRTANQTLVDNTDRSVFLKNVYAWRAGTLVRNHKDISADAIGNANGWARAGEYSFYQRAESRLIDDRGPEANNPPVAQLQTSGIAETDVPADMILRHVWDAAEFPHFEANAINIKDAPYGAIPGDGNDDATALQNAIDDAETQGKAVFVPKGLYQIGRTLTLHKNTRLIGVSRNLTIIECIDSWSAPTNTPMIDTDNDVRAQTTLAFMRLEMPADLSRHIYETRWRAGRHSIVREVWFEKAWSGVRNIEMWRCLITGNGGGRWYNLFHRTGGGDSQHPKHRYLLVQNTSEPLNIYTYCPEYAVPNSEYQSEFVGARNICLFGLKIETTLQAGVAAVSSLGITNCQNVLITGNTGIGEAEPGKGIIETRGSSDLTLANLARWGQTHSSAWYYVLNLDSGQGLRESANDTATWLH